MESTFKVSAPPSRVSVEMDEDASNVARAFDYAFSGESTFEPPTMDGVPSNYGIGLIVGPSGSGRSSLLRQFGVAKNHYWSEKYPVVSHFDGADDAVGRMSAVGFNSVPSWLRPYRVLSTGEKFRADLARSLSSGAVIDEYTSVVDRTVAKSCSVALRRYVDRAGLRNITLASCHYDIIEWLQPDWYFDTATSLIVPRRSLQPRPRIELQVVPCGVQAWAAFRQHHYLSADINKSSRCWLATWGENIVGFASAIAFPNGNFKNAWRGHRTVILPDYQGLGLGVRLSDFVAASFVADGCRYFSKTAHPRMGAYRDCNPNWRPTSKNNRDRKDYAGSSGKKESKYAFAHVNRVCWSHEYVAE